MMTNMVCMSGGKTPWNPQVWRPSTTLKILLNFYLADRFIFGAPHSMTSIQWRQRSWATHRTHNRDNRVFNPCADCGKSSKCTTKKSTWVSASNWYLSVDTSHSKIKQIITTLWPFLYAISIFILKNVVRPPDMYVQNGRTWRYPVSKTAHEMAGSGLHCWDYDTVLQ